MRAAPHVLSIVRYVDDMSTSGRLDCLEIPGTKHGGRGSASLEGKVLRESILPGVGGIGRGRRRTKEDSFSSEGFIVEMACPCQYGLNNRLSPESISSTPSSVHAPTRLLGACVYPWRHMDLSGDGCCCRGQGPQSAVVSPDGWPFPPPPSGSTPALISPPIESM